MPQYIRRKSKRRKKHLKRSFSFFLILVILLIAALLFFALRGCVGNGETGSDESAEEVSSRIVSEIITHPEATDLSIVSPGDFETPALLSAGSDILDVGHDYICEIISMEGETFNGRTKDDSNTPTSTPLPAGTVDYCSGTVFTNGTSPDYYQYRNYATLRCGKRVYYKTADRQVSKIYRASEYGALPETNPITLLSGGLSADQRHTVLTFKVDWKAPFTLDLLPQAYTSTDLNSRDFTIDAATYSYVDITFRYSDKTDLTDLAAADFTGTIFSRAEWRKNTADYTLRLYLNKVGGFYGWQASYDENGYLVFEFLNPKQVSVVGNTVDLNGAVIYLDVGHGGEDTGADGTTGGVQYLESNLNLRLANKVKKNLEALGATVVMSRTDDSQLSSAEHMAKLWQAKPDFALCIHHNSSDEGSGVRGFCSYHHTPFSSNAAHLIYDSTMRADLYHNQTYTGVLWHVYYTARVTNCPVVLTENGFMSNPEELAEIASDSFDERRAKALTDGVVDYFKSINGIS